MNLGGFPLYELNPNEYRKVGPIFASLVYNLAIESILKGLTPARIYVNNLDHPRTALIQAGQKLFLAGPVGAGEMRDLHQLIRDEIIPNGKGVEDALYLQVDPNWQKGQVEEILAGLYPVERKRMYLECSKLQQDWRGLLPSGYRLTAVDKQLVEKDHLENIDYLREELCSERPSIADFLEKSFGFCILREDRLASWCLSEYNTGDRCEIGVATVDEHQRRGLATVATLALVDHALERGYRRIGWHCWSRNLPSVALAKRAGFGNEFSYSIYICVFDLRIQFALIGDDFRSAGRHREALEWHQKAIGRGDAPGWVYFMAARSQAQLCEKEAAFASLRKAIDSGFDEMDQIRDEPDLVRLREDREWESLFKPAG